MLRIGICDDVYDARLVLRSALERALEHRRSAGAFFEFSSGEGLLKWLEHHAGELDLVFLDMEMGELDGLETARRLQGLPPVDFPRETAIGALGLYISNQSIAAFQPMNINFGIMPPLDHRVKGKRNKNAELSARSLAIIEELKAEVCP